MQEYEDDNNFEEEGGGEDIIIRQENHILPSMDTLEHSMSTRCICTPSVYVRHNTIIVVHNAFDRRELLEGLLTEFDLETVGADPWISIVVNI